MERKICSKCLIDKGLCEFNKNSYGLSAYCKECKKEYDKEYRKKNKERIDQRVSNWNKQNKEGVSQRKLNWSRTNKDRINKRIKARKEIDPVYKLKLLFRSKLNKILKCKKEKTFDIIGCTPNELKQHLESQFKEGMTWENHGMYGWHIDHIKPLYFGEDDTELKLLSHYTNLQPLWWNENLDKRMVDKTFPFNQPHSSYHQHDDRPDQVPNR